MRPARWVSLVAVAAVLVGCTSGPASAASSTSGSAEPSTAAASTPSFAEPKLKVTVPSLGSGPVSASVESGPASTVASSEVATPTDPVTSAESVAPSTPGESAAPTVPVELVGCGDCQVLATRAAVVGTYAAALISSGGRANLLSLDPTGAVVGIVNVPYGATFTAPADGSLACGAGGRCVVQAAQPDGRAILSAYQLTDTGNWVDLSGATGFVSATSKGAPILLEDTYGAAIQVSDGTTTVWMVLNWNGTLFGSIGCTPDGPEPDLSQLDPASCLS